MSLLIKNAFLNGEKKDLFIVNGLFSAIETHINTAADETINAEGKALFPAFYNAHTHAAMILLRGIGEDKPLKSWLEEDIWPLEAKLTPDMIYKASRMAALEMIKTGSVFFADMYSCPEQTARAVDEMGMKAALGTVGIDFFDPAQTAAKKETADTFLKQILPTKRVQKILSCHAIYTTSDDLITHMARLAGENNLIFHIHASETKQEVEECLHKNGCTPIEKLDRLGALSDKTVLAHCVHLTDHDIELIRQKKCVITHCPTSNMKLNSGQMPFQKYKEKGCRIALGTDGAASNNTLSMLSEMRMAALNAKISAGETQAGKIDDVFTAATKTAAQAFSLNAGDIKVGKEADFILLNMSHPLMMPNYRLLSNLIYAADSSCITDVFCNGRALMRDGKVPGENEIIDTFRKTCFELNGI